MGTKYCKRLIKRRILTRDHEKIILTNKNKPVSINKFLISKLRRHMSVVIQMRVFG